MNDQVLTPHLTCRIQREHWSLKGCAPSTMNKEGGLECHVSPSRYLEQRTFAPDPRGCGSKSTVKTTSRSLNGACMDASASEPAGLASSRTTKLAALPISRASQTFTSVWLRLSSREKTNSFNLKKNCSCKCGEWLLALVMPNQEQLQALKIMAGYLSWSSKHRVLLKACEATRPKGSKRFHLRIYLV